MTGRSLDDVALFRRFPALRARVPWVRLGAWPTPIERIDAIDGVREPIYVKREDLSSPRYGGNKVRTLEAMLGQAVAAGARRVWGTGAYGSNHVVATVTHAADAGLEAGAALFPQPASGPARANLAATLAARPTLWFMNSVVELPLVMAQLGRGDREFAMAPGAACPEGAFGAMNAALEMAEQVAAGACPAPVRIVVAVGSTCTTAGLLVGLHLAAALGVGFTPGAIPRIIAVRVTPWPVTSPLRIALLAYRTAQRLARLLDREPVAGLRQLRAALTVDGGYFGGGYGRATATGRRAIDAFRRAGGPPLDVVYSGKSGASLLARARRGEGPLLFWATKSSAPLAEPTAADVARAPAALRAWLRVPGSPSAV